MLRLLPLTLVALVLALPAAASASSTQAMSFEAPAELIDPAQREATLNEIQGFGVQQVRALVYWRQFAAQPRSRKAPRFDTADSNAYPAGTWTALDQLVTSTQQRGMTLHLTLTGPVPKWATARKRNYVDDPSPAWFGRWVRAVTSRYAGVKLWSIWNEPNHPDFLGPQYRKGTPHTPRLYRRLYVAGERAIHATPGHGADKVLFGETAPIGNQNVVSPLAFLRGALCLDRDYEKKAGCGRLRMAGYAHHAYTRKAGPSFVSEDTDEVSIGSLGRLSAALDKAAKARAIDKNRGIYLTEFGIQSRPDPVAGVSFARQAEFLAIAEKMAYANPRVKLFSQYLLRDDKPRKGSRLERYSGFESGLRTAKGGKKPAYNAFMLPLAVKRYGSSDVLWGRVRPATGPTTVIIEHKVGKGKWKRLTGMQTAGVYGLRTTHRSKHRYRVVWTRPDGRTITGPPIRPY